jgi:hypothetical protein
MRYSRHNIIQAHCEFLRLRGIEPTAQQQSIWSNMPVRFLARQLTLDRHSIDRPDSQQKQECAE